MEISAVQLNSVSQDTIASGIRELDARLLASGIGCYDAAESAFLEICKFAGMTDCEYFDTRAEFVEDSLVRRQKDRHPKAEAIDAYNAVHGVGAAQRKIQHAFHSQLAHDCDKLIWSEPHTKVGIQNTIRATADSSGVEIGRSTFGNDKPVLVAPIDSRLSLVASLYWPKRSPISPDAGLDWRFCLFDGDAEQARSAINLGPPTIYRLEGLSSVFSGIGYSLGHENTKQVFVFTKAMCVLMLWFSERFPFVVSQ